MGISYVQEMSDTKTKRRLQALVEEAQMGGQVPSQSNIEALQFLSIWHMERQSFRQVNTKMLLTLIDRLLNI